MLVLEVRDSLVFMKIKMISWNVSDLNDPQKRLVVKNFAAGVEVRCCLFTRDENC